MKKIIFIAMLLFLPALASAQINTDNWPIVNTPWPTTNSPLQLVPASQPCNAHQRKWYKPFSSNMCQEDYDKWVTPRLHDHWYKDKYFWIGVAVIGGSIAADAHSTSRFVDRGYAEGNPFLGPHPSHGRIAGFALLDFGAQTTFHALAWHESHQDPSKAWRMIGRFGEPVAAFAISGRQAITNYRLDFSAKPAGTP